MKGPIPEGIWERLGPWAGRPCFPRLSARPPTRCAHRSTHARGFEQRSRHACLSKAPGPGGSRLVVSVVSSSSPLFPGATLGGEQAPQEHSSHGQRPLRSPGWGPNRGGGPGVPAACALLALSWDPPHWALPDSQVPSVAVLGAMHQSRVSCRVRLGGWESQPLQILRPFAKENHVAACASLPSTGPGEEGAPGPTVTLPGV